MRPHLLGRAYTGRRLVCYEERPTSMAFCVSRLWGNAKDQVEPWTWSQAHQLPVPRHLQLQSPNHHLARAPSRIPCCDQTRFRNAKLSKAA